MVATYHMFAGALTEGAGLWEFVLGTDGVGVGVGTSVGVGVGFVS